MLYYSNVRSNIECSNGNLDIQIKKIIEKLIRNLLIDLIIIIIIQYSHVSLFYEHVRVSMAENVAVMKSPMYDS